VRLVAINQCEAEYCGLSEATWGRWQPQKSMSTCIDVPIDCMLLPTPLRGLVGALARFPWR